MDDRFGDFFSEPLAPLGCRRIGCDHNGNIVLPAGLIGTIDELTTLRECLAIRMKTTR